MGSPIYGPAVPLADDETAAGQSQYAHLQKKILELPDRMYTDAGRTLAADRGAFVREFVDQFDGEIRGDR